MNVPQFFRNAAVIAVFALGIQACEKEDEGGPGREVAGLNVHLTDAPAGYEAVNIDIRRVEIHTEQGGWQEVPLLHPGVYNLLDFRNGVDTLLCKVELPAGTVSQMRLVLGDRNSIVTGGETHELATPSAQQSGLKFNIHTTLEPGAAYDIWIDFDAGRSVVSKGNGSYSLKPVVRAFTALTDGRIKGKVEPALPGVIVYATLGDNTYSAIPDANGNFIFCGLPEGTYRLTLDVPEGSGFKDAQVTGVAVRFGAIADAGMVTLIP